MVSVSSEQIIITGVDLSGSDETANRTYTLPDTASDILTNSITIWVSDTPLTKGASYDYTYASGVITFINVISNAQPIQINYLVQVASSSTPVASSADVYTDLRNNIDAIFQDHVRLRFYTGSVSNSEWDDVQVLTQSGSDIYTSGLILPVRGLRGSNEAVLLEQGKIQTDDKRFYIKGNVSMAVPTDGAIKIGAGSPVVEEHFLLPDGIEAWPPTGTIVYKKVFGRRLPLGSLTGEM